jgi:hypothetical protein
MGHADVATEHAQQAIQSLDASKGLWGIENASARPTPAPEGADHMRTSKK